MSCYMQPFDAHRFYVRRNFQFLIFSFLGKIVVIMPTVLCYVIVLNVSNHVRCIVKLKIIKHNENYLTQVTLGSKNYI